MKIIERIRKLLSLAGNNPNENEAAIALAKAQELMLEHGLTELPEEHKIIMGTVMDTDRKYYGILGRATAELYGTQALFQQRTETFRFVGREQHVVACVVTLEFLHLQLEQLYKIALPKGMTQKERANFRKSFKEACAIRVYYRVRAMVKKAEQEGMSNCTALVVVDHRKQLAREAQDFLKATVKGLSSKSTSLAVKANVGGILGTAAGDKVRIHQEIKS